MFFDEIIHGTQYYRTPTPLPHEWEQDIPNLEKYNIDAFQIRMNWRWNERRENEYDFSDVDRLIELAEKNGRKVIMKFLLECAPQYIYENYDEIISSYMSTKSYVEIIIDIVKKLDFEINSYKEKNNRT